MTRLLSIATLITALLAVGCGGGGGGGLLFSELVQFGDFKATKPSGWSMLATNEQLILAAAREDLSWGFPTNGRIRVRSRSDVAAELASVLPRRSAQEASLALTRTELVGEPGEVPGMPGSIALTLEHKSDRGAVTTRYIYLQGQRATVYEVTLDGPSGRWGDLQGAFDGFLRSVTYPGNAPAPAPLVSAPASSPTAAAGVRATTAPPQSPGVAGATPRKIAFHSSRDNNADIYVINADGTGEVRLTTHASNDAQPSWSPDGRRIVFVSQRDGNIDLYIMNADGSGQTRLTNTPTLSETNPVFSPDGTKIAFVAAVNGQFRAFVINPDGSGAQQVGEVSAVSIAWSPDSKRIWYSSPDFAVPVLEVALDGSVSGSMPISAFVARQLAFSPNGRTIAFSTEVDGNSDIFRIEADGGNRRRLTDHAARDTLPRWSPDGTQIVFVSERDGNTEIYVMDANGGSLKRLTSNPGIDGSPSWR